MNLLEKHEFKAKFIIYGVEATEPYNGQILSVKNIEYELDGRPYENCIFIKYKILVELNPNLSSQDEIDRILLEEINLFFQAFALMLNYPFQLIDQKTWLDGLEVRPELLINELPLEVHNYISLLFPYRPKNELKGYSSLVDINGWPILEYLIKEFRNQPSSIKKKQLSFALRWFEKGSKELKSLDRFMPFWIAFNALYVDSTLTEQEAIKRYIGTNVNQELAKRFVGQFEKQLKDLATTDIRLRRRSGDRKISAELSDELKTKSRDEILILKKLSLVIYGVRNNIFHGSYDPDSPEEFVVINPAEYLLARLVKELIASQMLGTLLPAANFVIPGSPKYKA